MSDTVVRFIRKNGKVIPIRAAKGAGRAASTVVKGATNVGRAAELGASAHAIHKGIKHIRGTEHKAAIKVHAGLDALGLGVSIASGALAAATFGMGTKGFVAGHAAAHALDVAGVAANAAAVRGKGRTKDRIKTAATNEARNLVVGNAIYYGGVLGFRKNRQAAVAYAQKGAGYVQKIIALGRKALRV